MLLDNHVEINGRDTNGRTALHLAAIEGNLSVVKQLLRIAGMDINAKDSVGATALWWASKERHWQVVRLLLATPCVGDNANVELRAMYHERETSLHHAVQQGKERIIQLLLSKKTLNPNIPDNRKWTPLCYAADKGSTNIVSLLLKNANTLVDPLSRDQPSAL